MRVGIKRRKKGNERGENKENERERKKFLFGDKEIEKMN